jgi:hypothetical protein
MAVLSLFEALNNHSDCVIKEVAEYLLMVLSYSFGRKYVWSLRLTYPEHLCAAHRAHTLGRRPPILHLYCPRVLDLSLLAAFHTISLHLCTSFVLGSISYAFLRCQ